MRKTFFRSRYFIALVAALLGAAAVASIGIAGLWQTGVSTDTGNVRLRVVQNTAGNFDSGWHFHPGLVVVSVKKGEVAFTDGASCTTKRYKAGDSFVEAPYTSGRAVALGEFFWTATYIIDGTQPLATAVATSPCP